MASKGSSGDDPERSNVQPEEDLPPVMTVDWEAVEADCGYEIEPELRRVTEHEGSATSVALDKWGYGEAKAPPGAIREHGRIIHPERGPLDSRYASMFDMIGAKSVLRKLRGDDLNIGCVIEDGPDEAFVSGFADLYDAARALDERRDDWREGGHPAVSFGSYGPDKLGSHYVNVAHADLAVIESIDVSDLPIEREQVLAHGQRSYSSTDEHYTATFRHERYYPPKEREPTEADERAEEIGFLGANAGKTGIEQGFKERGFEYEERDAPDVDGVHRQLTLYEYENTDEGETRYAVEWSQRVTIDDYVIRSLIFDHDPSESDIQTALLIEDSRNDKA